MPKVLITGNEALAEAAVRAGCRRYFGYPITPQNEIPEYLSKRMPEVGGTFLQAESEVAAINMVYGAAAVGGEAWRKQERDGLRRLPGADGVPLARPEEVRRRRGSLGRSLGRRR